MDRILRISRHFSEHPKFLFLIDALGALLTVLILFFILRPNHNLVGIPQHIISYLAGIALLYFVYSLCCFCLLRLRKRKFLTVIGAANLFYCFVTVGIMVLYRNSITVLGVAYFSIEILIIIALAFFELRAGQIKK